VAAFRQSREIPCEKVTKRVTLYGWGVSKEQETQGGERMLDDGKRAEVLRRLRLIEGQVSGIQKMINERRYCMDIVTQVSAVEAALHKVAAIVLRNHMETCVLSAFRSTDSEDVEQKITELMRVYDNLRMK
jgi:DNA-binding FrmR family transcriptional regulator